VNSHRGATKEWVDLDTTAHLGAELVCIPVWHERGGGGSRPSGCQGTGTGRVRSAPIRYPSWVLHVCGHWGWVCFFKYR